MILVFFFFMLFLRKLKMEICRLFCDFFLHQLLQNEAKKRIQLFEKDVSDEARHLHCEKIKMDVWECLRFISASSICWISALLWTSWWRWYHSSSLHARTSAVRILYYQFCVTLISVIKKTALETFHNSNNCQKIEKKTSWTEYN